MSWLIIGGSFYLMHARACLAKFEIQNKIFVLNFCCICSAHKWHRCCFSPSVSLHISLCRFEMSVVYQNIGETDLSPSEIMHVSTSMTKHVIVSDSLSFPALTE